MTSSSFSFPSSQKYNLGSQIWVSAEIKHPELIIQKSQNNNKNDALADLVVHDPVRDRVPTLAQVTRPLLLLVLNENIGMAQRELCDERVKLMPIRYLWVTTSAVVNNYEYLINLIANAIGQMQMLSELSDALLNFKCTWIRRGDLSVMSSHVVNEKPEIRIDHTIGFTPRVEVDRNVGFDVYQTRAVVSDVVRGAEEIVHFKKWNQEIKEPEYGVVYVVTEVQEQMKKMADDWERTHPGAVLVFVDNPANATVAHVVDEGLDAMLLQAKYPRFVTAHNTIAESIKLLKDLSESL